MPDKVNWESGDDVVSITQLPKNLLQQIRNFYLKDQEKILLLIILSFSILLITYKQY